MAKPAGQQRISIKPRGFPNKIETVPWNMIPERVREWIITNRRYVKAGIGKTRDMGLCMGVVDDEPCIKHHLKTSVFCRSCKKRYET